MRLSVEAIAMRRRWLMSLALVVALAALGSSAAAASRTVGARGLDYRCRLVATRLGDEITLMLRLRTNQARDAWRIRMYHEQELIFSKIRMTNALGNLKVVRHEPNLPGRDDLLARARHLDSGTVCEVASRI